MRGHSPLRSNRTSNEVTSKKRSQGSAPSKRSTTAATAQLNEVRGELRAAITKLKALGCEDSMVLVEFWHALDCVNGEDCADI
jgi:hypothetical protein